MKQLLTRLDNFEIEPPEFVSSLRELELNVKDKEYIINHLYSITYGYPSIASIVKMTGFNRDFVGKVLRNNNLYTKFVMPTSVKKFAKYIVQDVDEIWQSDLMDCKSFYRENIKENEDELYDEKHDRDWVNFNNRYNNGYRYVVIVIDALTKYLWAFTVQRKTAENVRAGFVNIVHNNNGGPKELITDDGKEYYGKMNSFYKSYGIKHTVRKPTVIKKYSASMAERVIRTLRRMIMMYLKEGHYSWYDIMEQVVNIYNSNIHSTIGMSPTEARTADVTKLREKMGMTEKVNMFHSDGSMTVETRAVQPITIYGRDDNFKFEIGENVKLLQKKRDFTPGFHPSFTNEWYKVISRGYVPSEKNTYAKAYRIDGIRNLVYEQEIV